MTDQGEFRVVPEYVSEDQCQTWRRIILEHRDQWVKRFSFYTYGRAWYADIESGNLPAYHAAAPTANALVDTLPGFKDSLVAATRFLVSPSGDPLGARARRENLGPYWCDAGLHILGEGCEKGGVAHVDLEGLSPYPEAMFDLETRAFSAVLSVSNPAEGGDVLVWPKRRFLASDLEDIRLLPKEAPERLKCQTGSLLLFDSFLYHKIDQFRIDEDASWRITGIIHFLYRREPEPHWEYWF